MDQRTLRSTSSMGTPSSATASPNPNKSLLGRLTHSPNSSQLSSKTRAILAKLDELDTPARQVRRMPVLRRPAVERWVNPSPAKQSKREGAADRSLFALPVRRMTSANSSTPDSPVFSASTFNLTAPVLPLPQSSRSLDAPPLRRAADLVPSRLEILQQTLGTSTIRAKPYWRDLTRTPKQANPSLLPNGGGASSVEASQASISFVNGNTSFNASKLCSLFDMDMGVKSVQRKTALPPPTRKIHQKPMKGVEPTQKKPTNVFSARFSEEDEDSNQGYDQEAYKKEMLSIKPLSEGTAAVDDRFKNLAFSFLKPRQNSAMEVLRTEAAMETQQHSSDESDDAEVEIVESRQNNDSREVNESVEEKQSEEGSEGCSSDESGDESDAEKDKHKRDKQETSVSPITPADSSSTGVEASPISSKSVSPASPPTQSIQTQPPAAIVSSTSDVPLVKQTNGDSTGLIGANANKEAAWDCEACFVSNNSDKENCVCCGASKPGPKKSAAAGASDDKPWDCQDCFVQNKADQSKCGCCGASKPGSSSSAPSQPAAPAPQRTLVSNIATFGASKQTSGSYSFGFSSGSTGTGASSAMPAATTASAPVGANSAESVTSSTTTTAPLFGIGTGTGTSSTAPIFGSGFGSKPAAVTTTAATSNQVAPPIFGFGLSAPAVSKPSETSTSSAPAVSSANPAAPIQSLFGSGSSSGIFGSGLLGKPSGTAAPTTTASSFAASAPAPFTFGQPQLGTAGNKETVVTTTASATAPFTFGAKPAESTSSSAAPTITFGSLQPGTATAAASPFGSLTTSLSQTKPAPTATTSGPAASSPFTFGAKPAGDTANSTAPAPVFGGFGAIKPLVSSSNSDSAASGIPASSPFSGFGLPASASKASDSSITAASTAAPSIPSFTGFGASFGKTPGIVSTVSASASAPALFGFGGNAVNNKPPDAVSSTSTAVPTFAPFGSLAKPAAPSSSGNPFGGGPSLQPSSDLPSTFQFGVPQPSTGLANGTSSAAGQGLFVFGGGNSGQAVGGEQQQAAPSINLFGAPSDSSATSFQLGGDSQFSNAFSYNSAASNDARRKIAVARRRKPGAR